jgi:Phosphotransferase system cellobiose-specific component IIB
MKVLLICAGGASTSILMKKMEKYAAEKDMPFEVIAIGAPSVDEHYKNFDVILLGPQISYKQDDIAKATGKPLAVIAPMDYALGNVDNIFKQLGSIYTPL